MRNASSWNCLALCTLVVACHPGSMGQLHLASGETILELAEGMADGNSLSVVLLLDPEECLRCLSNLNDWVRERRSPDSVRVAFVLSRAPSDREVTQLRLHRIPIDGVLVDRVNPKGLTGFHALVFDKGVLALNRSLVQQAPSDSLLEAFFRTRIRAVP